MEPMTWGRFILNNPEWMGVISNSIFAATTIGVIIWQVLVMRKQVKSSDRNERIQNRLMKLQHEHEWLARLNEEREQLLKLARKLHLNAAGLEENPRSTDSACWTRLEETADELRSRLSTLDLAVFTGQHDDWFPNLHQYVDAIVQATVDDYEFKQK